MLKCKNKFRQSEKIERGNRKKEAHRDNPIILIPRQWFVWSSSLGHLLFLRRKIGGRDRWPILTSYRHFKFPFNPSEGVVVWERRRRRRRQRPTTRRFRSLSVVLIISWVWWVVFDYLWGGPSSIDVSIDRKLWYLILFDGWSISLTSCLLLPGQNSDNLLCINDSYLYTHVNKINKGKIFVKDTF